MAIFIMKVLALNSYALALKHNFIKLVEEFHYLLGFTHDLSASFFFYFYKKEALIEIKLDNLKLSALVMMEADIH